MSDQGNSQGTDFLAHIRDDAGRPLAHRLEDHLRDVSRLAADFAAEFGAASWAALAGLWHDLGKFREGFQRYIRQCHDPDAHIEGRVAGAEKTHSAAGALWAQRYLKEVQGRSGEVVARVLSYLIAGHHAGLADWAGENSSLHNRFAQSDAGTELNTTLAADIPPAILKPNRALPDINDVLRYRDDEVPGRFALWVRLLFSCLVDADFLDTEFFMSPSKADARAGFLELGAMDDRLTEYLDNLAKAVADRGETDGRVNRKRAGVLCACLAKAERPPGVFSLPSILTLMPNLVEAHARGYDAVHLAAADRVRLAAGQDLVFLSFDRVLNRAARLLGLHLAGFAPC